MPIAKLFEIRKPVVSAEIFPPKRDAAIEVIDEALNGIVSFAPDFVSVTYGAGGSDADLNIETSRRVMSYIGCPVLAHLTCVGASPDSIDEVLGHLKANGISDILALRGDIPAGMSREDAFKHFRYASDLIAYIAKKGGFNIAAACYPEMHIESESHGHDVEMLKRKVDSGASFLITQMFFDNGAFFDFLDRVRAKGVDVPVTAGVMPIRNPNQILRMTTLCGASIPAPVSQMIARCGAVEEDFSKASEEFACRQTEELVRGGADGIHLYTMNRPELIGRILKQTGLR